MTINSWMKATLMGFVLAGMACSGDSNPGTPAPDVGVDVGAATSGNLFWSPHFDGVSPLWSLIGSPTLERQELPAIPETDTGSDSGVRQLTSRKLLGGAFALKITTTSAATPSKGEGVSTYIQGGAAPMNGSVWVGLPASSSGSPALSLQLTGFPAGPSHTKTFDFTAEEGADVVVGAIRWHRFTVQVNEAIAGRAKFQALFGAPNQTVYLAAPTLVVGAL